jgi:arabinose-5-phosphate isomerase
MSTAAEAAHIGREVIAAEAEALRRFAAELNEEGFGRTVDALLNAADRVIVSGLGKSGNIAQKIAASLTSTGTPANYMHPVEALHGDLGIVTQRHALIALSRSGNTDEIVRFVAHFRRLGGPVIGVTQGKTSRLAELSDHLILLPDLPEAGPLALAPTTSCILQLAAGDALAMALLARRGFSSEDFASFHPEGSLGRRLLLRAQDLMHKGDEMPLVSGSQRVDALLLEMTRKRLGLALIVHDDGTLLGTFTDGDFRRLLERVENPRKLTAAEAHAASRRDPGGPPVPISSVPPQKLAVECLRIMRDSQITALVVTEDGRPQGVLRLMDLIQAGLS